MRIIHSHFYVMTIAMILNGFGVSSVRADDVPATTSEKTGLNQNQLADTRSSDSGMNSWISIYQQIVSPSSQPAPRETSTSSSSNVVPSSDDTPSVPIRSTSPNSPLDSKTYIVTVGDKLGYRIAEDHDEAKVLTVSPSGDIDIPFLGRVSVSGKRLEDAAKEISSLLEKDLYRQATVVLSLEDSIRMHQLPSGPSGSMQGFPPVKPKKVTIVGQVRAQGIQEIPPDEKFTLSEAILKAGGFASFANAKKVKIIRRKSDGTTETLYANVLEVLEDGNIDKDVVLKPDDLIIVPEKWINF
jgi:protein involved in polysaccharide export with SLBB domain